MKISKPVVLKDCLYNLHMSSGASDDYCKGLIVGIAALMVAAGYSLDHALQVIALHMPASHRALADCTPESWATDLQHYDTMTRYCKR